MSSFTCPSCKAKISGMSCAFMLSYAFGVKAKEVKHSWCKCRYPIRAKEIRSYYFSDFIDDEKFTTTDAFIYCENSSGQGHVYYGTWSKCKKGNGLSAKEWEDSGVDLPVFERYKYFS